MTRARSGNTAVTVALSSVVLLVVGTLVVDIGYARTVQAQLQNAADASAHAGTAQLDGTAEGMAAAQTAAISIASQHRAGGQTVAIDTADLVFGIWDGTTFTTSMDPVQVNALQVSAQRDAVSLLFAPAAVGRDSLDLAASSGMTTVRSGAGAVDCYLPIAMPDCVVEAYARDGLQEIELVLNPAPGDNVGYARANGSVNASWTRTQVADCEAGGTAALGDPLTLQNGEAISALDAIVDAVRYSSTTWSYERWGDLPPRMDRSSINPASYGRTWEGVVLLFDGGDEYCSGAGAWNGSAPITGFVWGAVFDVRNTGAAVHRTMRMRLDTTDDHDVGTTAGGGPDLGVIDWTPPRMLPSR